MKLKLAIGHKTIRNVLINKSQIQRNLIWSQWHFSVVFWRRWVLQNLIEDVKIGAKLVKESILYKSDYNNNLSISNTLEYLSKFFPPTAINWTSFEVFFYGRPHGDHNSVKELLSTDALLRLLLYRWIFKSRQMDNFSSENLLWLYFFLENIFQGSIQKAMLNLFCV